MSVSINVLLPFDYDLVSMTFHDHVAVLILTSLGNANQLRIILIS